MRQWSIVGSVGPPYGPGRQGSMHVQASRAVLRLGPAWADHEPSWAVPPEDVQEDDSEPDVLESEPVEWRMGVGEGSL
jgi:hypothetical protein